MKKTAVLYLTLLNLFFFISLGLGYAVLNRYAPTQLDALSDSAYYADLVRNGLAAVSPDFRSTRLFLPLIAHGVYQLMPDQLGSWDIVSLSMLIVNSLFCALSGLLIFNLGLSITRQTSTALIAAFLFFLNFSICNFYLTGLIDSGVPFSFLLLTYALYKQKWNWLPAIAVVGCLIKEAFLPTGVAFLGGWMLADLLSKKRIVMSEILFSALFMMAAIVMVEALRVYATHEFRLPWQYMPAMGAHAHYQGVSLLLTVARFMYVFVWLLPLALPSLLMLPRNMFAAVMASGAIVFALEWWVGASGAGFGRTLFDIGGPIFCIAAAMTLSTLSAKDDASNGLA